LPRNLLPADFYAINPEHSHPALVVMLVLTQLSVGAFAVDHFLGGVGGSLNAAFALALGLAALGASVFHLGQPRRAWRALVGLRTSWLSREIAGFSLFALLAALSCFRAWIEPLVVASGIIAVACSVMVYAATRRPTWSGPATGFRFFSSSLVL